MKFALEIIWCQSSRGASNRAPSHSHQGPPILIEQCTLVGMTKSFRGKKVYLQMLKAILHCEYLRLTGLVSSRRNKLSKSCFPVFLFSLWRLLITICLIPPGIYGRKNVRTKWANIVLWTIKRKIEKNRKNKTKWARNRMVKNVWTMIYKMPPNTKWT